MTPLITVLYWVVALAASAFYSWNAVTIFLPPNKGKVVRPLSWQWHQRWLNFLGSGVGWLALWLIGRKYLPAIAGSAEVTIDPWDIVGFFAAFIGVTGNLPYTAVSLVQGVGSLASRLAELIGNWIAKGK
jgi:hypothetical protein